MWHLRSGRKILHGRLPEVYSKVGGTIGLCPRMWLIHRSSALYPWLLLLLLLLLLHSAARDCGIKPWRITVIIRIVSLAAQPIRLTITLPMRCSVILREANTWRLVERVDGDRSVSVCIISRKFRQSTSQSAINGVVSVSLHSGKKILTLFLKDCLSVDKKLICRKETARCFVSLNISLSHSRSLKMVPFESLDTVSYSNSL